MSARTEKKLLDFGKWWEYNKDTPVDPKKQYELTKKAIDSLAHIYIDIVEDLRVLEGRGPMARNIPKIVTPDNFLKKVQRV